MKIPIRPQDGLWYEHSFPPVCTDLLAGVREWRSISTWRRLNAHSRPKGTRWRVFHRWWIKCICGICIIIWHICTYTYIIIYIYIHLHTCNHHNHPLFILHNSWLFVYVCLLLQRYVFLHQWRSVIGRQHESLHCGERSRRRGGSGFKFPAPWPDDCSDIRNKWWWFDGFFSEFLTYVHIYIYIHIYRDMHIEMDILILDYWSLRWFSLTMV